METNKLYKLSYYREGGKWESELSFSHSIDKLQRSVVVNGAWTVVNDPNSPSLKRESNGVKVRLSTTSEKLISSYKETYGKAYLAF